MKTIKFFIFIGFIFLFFSCEKQEIPQPLKEEPIKENRAIKSAAYFPVPSSCLGTRKGDTISALLINELPAEFNSSLTAYFPFNDSLTDESLNALSGKVLNGRSGNRAFFNDILDSTFIEIPDPENKINNNLTTFTLCVWYLNSKPSYVVQGLISKPRTSTNAGYSIHLSNWKDYYVNKPGSEYRYDRIIFDIQPNDGSNPIIHYVIPKDSINGWHFVCATYNGAWMHLYFDGVLRTSLMIEREMRNLTQSFLIGREADIRTEPTPRYFYGALDNIMIFNKELSDKEIKTLFNLKQ